MIKRTMTAIAMMVTLAACGSEAPAPESKEKAAPAAFPSGAYDISAVTQSLRSADKTTPATRHKVGATDLTKACSPGPNPAPALFADKGDTCESISDYVRDGRISQSFKCRRPGAGPLTLSIDGSYGADSFDVTVATSTIFSGDGDYVLSQKVTGKRSGDCTASGKAG